MANIKNEPITIDTKTFLKAFFPDEKTTVYIRTFDDNKERNEDGHNYSVELRYFDGIKPTLTEANSHGLGVFFVVNGGGQNKKAVISSKSCSSQFMEIDEDENGNVISFDKQLELINAFPLRPSIVVRTKKSLHSYWLLKNGNIHRFRGIQEKLIYQFHSDSRIKDECRVMRLPPFNHCKQEPIRVEVIHFEPELRYTQDELEAVLPEVIHSSHTNVQSINSINENIISSHRVDTLVSLVGRYKNIGMSNEAIKIAISGVNQTMCIPPISESRLEKEVFPSIERWDSKPLLEHDKYIDSILEKLRKIKPEINYKWDDKGNGSLFAELFKDMLRWNVTANEWFFYDNSIWKEDSGGMIASRCAKSLANALLSYSTSIEDELVRGKYQQHILKLGQLRFRKTMIEDAKDKYFISADVLDKDIYLLNVQNVVIDTKTFDVIEHDPDLLLSKICNVSYNPDTRCERWEKFVDEVMQGDKEKIKYLKKALGYSLTGDTREETCFILYGSTTRNGKSTLVETIGYMLGGADGYALNMKPETLATKQNNDSRQASGDIARLKGCRFLNASEPPKKMIFDVGLLKTLLGRDNITARFLHQSEFQFIPFFKLFINTNFLPLITDDTLFSSGRINVIRFDRHFSESEQDKGLKDELQQPEALSGILNWCLDGLKLYYKEGLIPPDAIKTATEDYRTQSDKLGNFISERLEPSLGHNISAKIVYEQYQLWCKDNGYGQENKGNFFSELRTKGILAKTGTVNGMTIRNVVVGYSLSKDFYSTTEEAALNQRKNDLEYIPFD